MPKKKPKIKIESYGRYSKWERGSKALPKILEFTNTIDAIEGNEFGMILKIEGGRGIKLEFCIKHPPFTDKNGDIEPDFTGEHYVLNNNSSFYIGDCIWLPVQDKTGTWEITVFYEGQPVASSVFEVVSAAD